MDFGRPHSLRTSFKKSKVIAPLHTGGPIAVTSDGKRLITCVGTEALLVDVDTSSEICRFKGDETSITSISITPSGSHAIMFYSSLFLRVYEIPQMILESSSTRVAWSRQIPRAHDAPIHVSTIDPTSSYIASGSADGVVKIWDIQGGFVTHVFKGHGGVVSAVLFNFSQRQTPDGIIKTTELITGSVDSRIRIFDLASKASGGGPQAVLEGHVSVPRAFSVSKDGRWLLSGGRDSVVLVWDLLTNKPVESKSSKKRKGPQSRWVPDMVKTIPVFERVEALSIIEDPEILVPIAGVDHKLCFFMAGEKGVVRIWSTWPDKVLVTLEGQSNSGDMTEDAQEQRQISSAFFIPAKSALVTMHADQNILFHSLKSRTLTRQLIGFNDEIVDTAFLSSSGRSNKHIALATNSHLIRIYDFETSDARLVSGHTDMVLCLDKSSTGHILASGSKDKSARLWMSSENQEWGCIAVCEGHAESIGAIAIARRVDASTPNPRFLFTGSQDRTVKMWDLSTCSFASPQSLQSTPSAVKSLLTHKAHDKDINTLDVSPNDRLLATGSQDKTAKIFEIDYVMTASGARGHLKLIGTLHGHKRGVWNVRFSRHDRVIASASGDKTIKLWNLDDYSCLKTFEGHTNSVLRVEFLNRGIQLLSAASDGLVKLWNIKSEECMTSLDNHEDKIWALAISSDERTVLSGAADSVLTFWTDCTEEEIEEKEAKKADEVLKEQDFLNYLSLQDYKNAILLALSMDQPGRLFKLFENIRSSRMSNQSTNSTCITGNASVDIVIKTLSPVDLSRLLRHIRNWTASSKTYAVAQTVLHAVFKLRTAEDIMTAFGSTKTVPVLGELDMNIDENTESSRDHDHRALKEVIDGLVPYTERHLARADKMIQESFIVDYILSEMDAGLIVGEENGMDLDM
ncbi:U3 small nucleolar RNA-associated protein 13 [Tulasnella sp. 418]|nr:U3 small nucleolar RNA-associated protein 13 [Tulasnella sp. 418]